MLVFLRTFFQLLAINSTLSYIAACWISAGRYQSHVFVDRGGPRISCAVLGGPNVLLAHPRVHQLVLGDLCRGVGVSVPHSQRRHFQVVKGQLVEQQYDQICRTCCVDWSGIVFNVKYKTFQSKLFVFSTNYYDTCHAICIRIISG